MEKKVWKIFRLIYLFSLPQDSPTQEILGGEWGILFLCRDNAAMHTVVYTRLCTKPLGQHMPPVLWTGGGLCGYSFLTCTLWMVPLEILLFCSLADTCKYWTHILQTCCLLRPTDLLEWRFPIPGEVIFVQFQVRCSL